MAQGLLLRVAMDRITPEDFKDVRDYFTAVADHTCDKREISVKDHQGTTIYNTFVGYECRGCGAWFRLTLASVKATQRPLHPYLLNRPARADLAARFNTDPQALLYELRNSGGWAQPDPGVAMMHAIAATAVALGGAEVVHGEGPQAVLDKMMKGNKPS
jgi:hypothetical protein